MKKRDLAYLSFFVVFTIIFSILIYNDIIYNLSFNNYYIFIIFFLLALSVIFIIFHKDQKIITLKTKIPNWIYFIIFTPLLFYPVIKCFFKVPLIFCRVCPRQCIFGHLRRFTLPSFVLLNLDKKYWCYNLCPAGMLQDSAYKVKNKKFIISKKFRIMKYYILIILILTLLAIRFNTSLPMSMQGVLTNTFIKTTFSFSIIVFIFFSLMFIISFFINRFWCNHVCPIGTIADIALKIEKKLKKK